MSWQKYAGTARNEARTVFIYRGSLGALLLSSLVLIALQYLVWRSAFHGSESRSGVTFTQVVLYAVLARLWVFILPGFRIAADFEKRTRDGSIVRDLMYPASFVGMWLAKAIGRSAGWFLFIAVPLLVGAVAWIRPDLHAAVIAPAVISAVFGYLIAFCLAGFVGLSSLFLRRADGLNELRDALSAVLGGSLVPLVFYPAAVAGAIRFLPFVYVYYVPVGLFSGMQELGWRDTAIGGAWALGLLVALVLSVRAARTRLVLDGG